MESLDRFLRAGLRQTSKHSCDYYNHIKESILRAVLCHCSTLLVTSLMILEGGTLTGGGGGIPVHPPISEILHLMATLKEGYIS